MMLITCATTPHMVTITMTLKYGATTPSNYLSIYDYNIYCDALATFRFAPNDTGLVKEVHYFCRRTNHMRYSIAD